MKLGIISDTHGLLRPEALAALGDSDLILHAGDVGRLEVLERLKKVAPTLAVRGNNDVGPWARDLSHSLRVEAEGIQLYLVHDLTQIDIDPGETGIAMVISGHSHIPKAEPRGDVLYLNPGSAGPRRFRLPVTLARVYIDNTGISHEIIDLLETMAHG